jgi:hypothetical protein
MCDKQVSRLLKILHSLATRMLRIVLQRAEETFPAVKEKHGECFMLVCTGKISVFTCQFSGPKKKLNML